MIKLLRVDDRLIHGQVATTWTKTLQADSIIVANDEVIHNELQIIALKLAVPAGMKANFNIECRSEGASCNCNCIASKSKGPADEDLCRRQSSAGRFADCRGG